MPTLISDLLLKYSNGAYQTHKWGSKLKQNTFGNYIVSLVDDISHVPHNSLPRFSDEQIQLWMTNAPDLLLNGKKPSIAEIKKHLQGFWLQDESILYIGKAEKQVISVRVGQFFSHKVGKSSPHKGGFWVKLLSEYENLYLHCFESSNPDETEKLMLSDFMTNVSMETKQNLIDSELRLPFGNLQLKPGKNKSYQFTNQFSK